MSDKKETKPVEEVKVKTTTAKKPAAKPVKKEEVKVELTRDKVEEIKETRKPKKDDGKFFDKHGKAIDARRARNMGLDRKTKRKDARTK